MADFYELIGATGNAATAVIAYILWRHEMRLTRIENKDG